MKNAGCYDPIIRVSTAKKLECQIQCLQMIISLQNKGIQTYLTVLVCTLNSFSIWPLLAFIICTLPRLLPDRQKQNDGDRFYQWNNLDLQGCTLRKKNVNTTLSLHILLIGLLFFDNYVLPVNYKRNLYTEMPQDKFRKDTHMN